MTTSPTRETGWTAAGFGVQFVGQVARAILLARLLTPADLGRFLVLRSIIGVVALAAQGGLGPVGMRRIAAAPGDPAAWRGVVGAVVPMTATSAVAAAGLTAAGVLAAGFAPIEAGSVALLVLAGALSPVLAALARGLGLTKVAVAIERGLATLLEVAVLAAVLGSAGSATLREALGLVALVAMLPVALLLWRVTHAVRHVPSPVTRQSPARAPVARRALLAESWPVTVNGLLWRALAEVDLWLVGGLAGAPAAAVYGVAGRLATALQGPVAIGAYALAPPIAALHADGRREALESLLRRTARWTTAAAAAGYVAVLAIGADGLGRIFGPDYAGAHSLFLVLGLAQVINAACGLGGTTLLMVGQQRRLMWISFGSSAITVGGGWMLIPAMGPMGAALAAATALTVQNALMVGAVRRYAGVRVHA
jgi:O-antigen/teichoic acid export membrane protein